MNQSTGPRIRQAHAYDLDGVKVLATESSSEETVSVCEIVENPPGVHTLGPSKKAASSTLVPVPMAYYKGQLP